MDRVSIKRMTAPAFRPKGRTYAMHEILGVGGEVWAAKDLREKLKLMQAHYLKLTKLPRLNSVQRKHMNAMKRWFTIQKRKNPALRSRITSFFQRDVNRLREKKRDRGEKKASVFRVVSQYLGGL